MAKDFPALDTHLIDFIERQKIFFTASATDSSRVNMSPRSTDCFRVIDNNSVIYLDRTGSGDETAAHMLADGRMTVMFCALEGPPRILRLYGKGEIVHRNSTDFAKLLKTHFNDEAPMGLRQLVLLRFDLVKTSCGYGVPLFSYEKERESIDRWEEAKGPEGIKDYWRQKNVLSMDGLETGIFDDHGTSGR
ncbi:MAG: pyridoxamine 5'-phosphate oxidase family protein [Hyphomicrobiales bacterium]